MILVVDDNPFDATFVVDQLSGMGYACLVASDGCEAIALMPEHHARIELILLDLDMPGIDGISALGHFKTHYADIPVVIVTGMEDAEHETTVQQWRVAGFYTKPITQEMLALAVSQRKCHPGHG